ncbi:hypothetical protein QZH56_26000 [Streptomyces olivoreticuli]|uniref:hypothetical protein n=1 Tax=Streptomyces olivoreticuli TaxID=68246 RepID=UPI00265B2282|nr:hypothetical protein [Streptomyces olivoreticuli]WKK22226.1 hypothetical protein QZH56_26000 [Streptomyces olivoreticuli]
MLRRKAASVAVVAVLSLSGAITGTTTATAASDVQDDCYHGHTHSQPGSAYGIMKGTYNLKTGPYQKCGNVRSVSTGTKIWIWCETTNKYNNDWVYARVEGTNDVGWMSFDNYTMYGLTFDCG